jgi:uncharacterized protein (TIGR03083 family)
VLGWLEGVSPGDFARPTVLPTWDVRTLTGHLVLIHAGFMKLLDRPAAKTAIALPEWVRRYRRDVELISDSTNEVTGERSGAELVVALSTAIDGLAERLLGGRFVPQALDSPRGPTTVADFVATRIIEVVVHADDLSRSLPEREPILLHRRALSSCSRTLTGILAGQHPGRSIEVRIPPYAAVQCGIGDPGPTHTRGTPPNVVETDPVTFLRLATGRISWPDAVHTGRVAASGLRADLTAALPLLS